jgi:hypothetical protein
MIKYRKKTFKPKKQSMKNSWEKKEADEWF